MKTKDFIKMLQDEDPTGESHVRLSGGIPYAAEMKPGYYDGPYSYIDEDGNYVCTSQGSKVDIYCKELDDFVDDHVNIHDPENWEKIKSKFKFDYNNYMIVEQRQERINNVLKHAKESYDSSYEVYKGFYDKSTKEMIENAKKGWTWFQNKDVDKDIRPNLHYYYTWKIYDEFGKEQGSNVHMTESVLKSGLWVKLDNNVKEGYFQWVLK
jgi:hypothetical protein